MPGLDDMIDACRGLGDFAERTAERVAEKLDQHVKATASAGQSPAGKAWAPTKKGGRAMKKAADHVTTKAFGPVVRQTLTGPDVFHQYGVRGEPVRQVIPDAGAGVPPEVDAIVRDCADRVFDELTGGVRR